MDKNKKIIIGVAAVALVVAVVFLAGRSELFQGRFGRFGSAPPSTKIDYIDYARLFLYRGKVVSPLTSPVTSPVSSVVISNVTSPAGTSRVASVVTSPVASAVASAVAVDEKIVSGIDIKKLKNLTGDMLRLVERADYGKNPAKFARQAREDLINNPAKFTLPLAEKERMIELYKQKYPSKFIFKK